MNKFFSRKFLYSLVVSQESFILSLLNLINIYSIIGLIVPFFIFCYIEGKLDLQNIEYLKIEDVEIKQKVKEK